MSGEQYTQVRRPVSRLAEKVLGWLSWVFLLLLTVITMFIALVSFSSETSIQNLETTLNGNDFVQQILANNSLNTTQFVIWLQNGVWAVIVYFIVCLLISFLALISMNMRILSGILFLVASVITLPLVLLFVTLIIPIFFFIIAIMMLVRKSKVETVPAYGYQPPYYPRDEYDRDSRYYDDDRYDSDGYEDYDDYEEDYDEPPRKTKKSERRTRRKQPYYNDEVDYDTRDIHHEEDQHSHFNEEERAPETEEDRYNQYPKRAVTGEYQSQTPDEESNEVLSRQAKYKQKSNRKPQYEDNHDESGDFADDVVETEPKVDKKEEKAQRKKEKAEIKAKKKEKRKAYNQRMKERRKNQPSAVSQRRMNYEERKQILNKDDEQPEVNSEHDDDKNE